MQLVEDFNEGPVAFLVGMGIPWFVAAAVKEMEFALRDGEGAVWSRQSVSLCL